MRNIITISFALIVTLAIAGCGDTSKPTDLPPLFPCNITITQEGVPLAGAMVEFVSTYQTKYRALSITGDDGAVQMSTYGFAGVPAGKYKVIVTKKVDDDIVYKKNDSTGEDEPVSWNTYQMVEDKYSKAESSPHDIEITGKGKTEQTFDVGKAVKVKMQHNRKSGGT